MRITIKNTINGRIMKRELIVKIRYDKTKPIVKHAHDEFGRDVYTVWQERVTTVSCHEYDPENESSTTLYVGRTVCNYHDNKNFSKSTGRMLAWFNCLDEMLKSDFIGEDEEAMLEEINLNATAVEVDVAKQTVKKLI